VDGQLEAIALPPTTTTTAVLWLPGLCPGLYRWTGTRK